VSLSWRARTPRLNQTLVWAGRATDRGRELLQAADRVEVPGSERQIEPGHVRAGDVDPREQVQVTVYLRPRAAVDWVQGAARERRRLEREEFAEVHGASREDLAAVRSFAESAGLEVVGEDRARRATTLRGPLSAMVDTFGANMAGLYAPSEGAATYRCRTGSLSVPAALADIVTAVLGIDNRPQARARLRIISSDAAAASYTPVQVAEAYNFPSTVTGEGETVGIVELGGGFSTTDLETYFRALGVTPPSVTAVGVDGATNAPGTDADSDVEVMLDIEIVGSVAPGAAIAVYFAPNTDQGFIDAVSTAVNDTTHNLSVVSVSWGESEDSWTSQARAQMEQVLTDGAALGVTVTVAAGDNGSTDGVTDGQQHVDFPASAPHALGCGGTTLRAAGGQITSEAVWNDPGDGATGGGISRQFSQPSYQADAEVPDNVNTGSPGRGVPDVTGNADPNTGYQIYADGSEQVVGGTSAVAPLWAGLIALLNQPLGASVGFAQPRLYPLLGSAAFHDITNGDNGAYSATAGWDACSGLGSPDGQELATRL
jgi:kumamolisin